MAEVEVLVAEGMTELQNVSFVRHHVPIAVGMHKDEHIEREVRLRPRCPAELWY